MKLGRIKALCKAREYVELFDRRDGRQYISDGCGVWPVDEKLQIDEGVVRAIFEISQKKWEEDWTFHHIRFGEDYDAEECGLPECLLEDFWAAGSEVELLPLRERALIIGTEMRLYMTNDGREHHIWAPTAQFTACPDKVRLYTLRVAPDTSRAIAVYEDMFMSALVRVNGTGEQQRIQEMLRELGSKDVI